MRTFERFLSGMGKNVTSQGAGPGKHTLTVGTGDTIRSHTVSRFFLLIFRIGWVGIICTRVVAFRSTAGSNKTFFVTLIDIGCVSWTTVDKIYWISQSLLIKLLD